MQIPRSSPNLLIRFFVGISISIFIAGCGLLKEKQNSDLEMGIPPEKLKNITPEKSGEIVDEASENWLYGSGLGTTILNVGGIVLFPPYALYVLGNAGIEYAGYEGLYVSKLLPEEEEKDFNYGYNSVVSVPGQFAASLAGEEYRTKEIIAKRYDELLSK